MSFSLRATIRALVAPEHGLSCSVRLWTRGLAELRRRGGGRRESGAFLLGNQENRTRRVLDFVFYDDLEPHCLNTGIVVFRGAGYGPLWQRCRDTGLTVVADVHTHGGAPIQSGADRAHPMVAKEGHVALIVPDFATRQVGASDVGIYEYRGSHKWTHHGGLRARRFFYIGLWG